jgi:DIS3-like exonuclease 2
MEGLLMEHSIDSAEFSAEVLADLPANHASWSIPPEEIAARRDYRGECVFTIDPLTARDLDDALSVTRLDDGNYRLVVEFCKTKNF